MPNYKYSAVGSDGRTVSGRIDAASKTDCVAELRKRSLTPIDIQEKAGGGSAPAPSSSTPEIGAPSPDRRARAAVGRQEGGVPLRRRQARRAQDARRSSSSRASSPP